MTTAAATMPTTVAAEASVPVVKTKKATIAADVNINAQDVLMAQRVQSKAKSSKKRRQNQKRRKNASKAKKQLAFDTTGANAADQKEGKMAAVIRLFSPRSSGSSTGSGGGMASLFSPNAKKTKAVAEPVEEIPGIAEAPSTDTADETVGTTEDAGEEVEVEVGEHVNNVMAAVEAEAEDVEEEEAKTPVNLLGKSTNAPSDECNLQQCIIL
mmetsp:Transcript_14914/g.43051  ORF Transcript_14914/g.43051 Transcript_14914/m.43051 type:complete len:212 (-) Transcript_14914:150-785(-)